MGAPISPEVRAAIVRARRNRKLTYDQIADLMGVGRATVGRVLRRKRETGRTTPRPGGGGWSSVLRGRIACLLLEVVNAMPDRTVSEITSALETRSGVRTS